MWILSNYSCRRTPFFEDEILDCLLEQRHRLTMEITNPEQTYNSIHKKESLIKLLWCIQFFSILFYQYSTYLDNDESDQFSPQQK